MKWIVSTVVLVVTAQALAESSLETAEKQYIAVLEKAKQEYDAKTKAAKEQLLARLKIEMTNLTKAGDLDGAIKVRDRIRELEAVQPNPAETQKSAPAENALNVSADKAKDPDYEVQELKKSELQSFKIYSPDHSMYLMNKEDENGVAQIYIGKDGGSTPTCLTNTQIPGAPKANRFKMQPAWHPSGRWIFMAVEREEYKTPPLLGNDRKYVEGMLQCGLWTNMYAVSPDGKRWFRLTDFKSETHGVADGYTGPAFTPDGKRAAWNQIVDGNVFKYRPAGKWELILATFDDSDGVPKFINPKNITPAGMYWNEVGNFNPKDGSLLLLTGAMEKDAEKNNPLVLGMDQYTINIDTGKLTNLTKSPATWNEHGVFSPNGEKIVFMSSQPYKNEPLSATLLGVKTEFMLMNKDGSGLTQLTHFREQGYPEFGEGMAACAGFNADGRSLQMSRLIFPKYEYWELTFKKK